MKSATSKRNTAFNSKEFLDQVKPAGVSLVAQWYKKKKKKPCQCRRHDWTPGREDPLEEEMTTHSSIVAWETP